jgi:hypothetical protein
MRLYTLTEISRMLNVPYRAVKRVAAKVQPITVTATGGYEHNLYQLRAMIVNLTDTLPAQRHSALSKELELLDRTIEKLYVLPEHLKLARIPDLQGLGGAFWSLERSEMGFLMKPSSLENGCRRSN